MNDDIVWCPHCGFDGTDAEVDKHLASGVHEPYCGITEIAVLADVTPQAVCNWAARDDRFPEPIARLAMGRIYSTPEIIAYLRENRMCK